MQIKHEEIGKLIDEAPYEESILFGKVLVREYLLPSGFTVPGRAVCFDPKDFVLEVGQKIAHEDAKSKLWELEVYAMARESQKDGAAHAA